MCPKHAQAQSQFWVVKTELKANRASETEQLRKERLRIRCEYKIATAQLMLAMIKGVVNVGVVSPSNPVL